ncbi:MAG: type IV pilus assembly protein PilM [Planctomycetaceae bacterium]|nr:MAG: type IV pilus assembly protein PilM [Planctomycetaceae bacterium]
MATPKSVWGIDIGQCALKALKLRNIDGQLQVEAFDIIEHPRILSQPDADRKQLIHVALEQFLARNNMADASLVVSVPGQASFTRFVKLPPVEEKKIPDMAKFEAQQQIPFPIDDVIWRYQTFKGGDSPDVELGIFAMKKVDVADMLSNFVDVELGVDGVQMAPLALYNFMTFDGQLAEDGATLLADVGADKTDLVVSDGSRIWTRTIQIGGNNFTEALVRAFKLSFPKAEKLKRSAATSKYARQIFQAMRPVFADLVQEIQRSIGYYTSLHRESRFKRLIGLGNGFRLPGLQKFLEQNLNLPVIRIDSYNKLVPSATVNAPTFTENVLSFAVAYGLALQGLGQTTVTTNLLPDEVASQRSWVRKKPWFVGAAAALIISMGLYTYRQYADFGSMNDTSFAAAQAAVSEWENLRNQHSNEAGKGQVEEEQIAMCLKLTGYHQTWPYIEAMLSNALTAKFPDQREFEALSALSATDAFNKKLAEGLGAKARDKRQTIQIADRKSVFVPNIDAAYAAYMGAPAVPAGGQANKTARPGYKIVFNGTTPLSDSATASLLRDLRETDLRAAAEKYKGIIEVVGAKEEELKPIAAAAPAAAVTPAAPGTPATPAVGGGDPLFPAEQANGTSFKLTVFIAITGDGVKLPDELVKTPK